MASVTSPDSIVQWTNSDPASLVAESEAQAASIQAALLKRMRFDFVWADATERAAQTGMVQGSRGYQIDSRSEYLYDNSTWRLAIPHAEFTASKSVASGGSDSTLVGTFSLVGASTSDSTFAVPNGDGTIRLVNPGLYSFSANLDFQTPTMTTRTFAEFRTGGIFLSRESIINESLASPVLPNLWIESSNFDISVRAYQASGGSRTVDTRLRVTRLG